MPVLPIYNKDGQETGSISLPECIFDREINDHVVHEVIVNFLANQRQGTKNTKTVSEVRGGGRKPWRQKGTGRARQGSIRSAQWTGGGVALGPKARDYSFKINKKLKKIALFSMLTSKLRDKNLTILDDFTLENFKTKEMVNIFNNLNLNGKTLLVLDHPNKQIVNSTRNLKNSSATYIGEVNVYDIVKHLNCILTRSAVNKLEEVYCNA